MRYDATINSPGSSEEFWRARVRRFETLDEDVVYEVESTDPELLLSELSKWIVRDAGG